MVTPELSLFRVKCEDTGVFVVSFEQISHIVLVFFLVNFTQVNVGWVLGCRKYHATERGLNFIVHFVFNKQ